MSAGTVDLKLKRETLSERVRDYLLDRIVDDRLTPGDLAPSEVQISQQLGVSRPTVREAYRGLAGSGILEVEAGKWRLRALSPSIVAGPLALALRVASIDTADLLQLRRAIEVYAAELAAQNATDAQRAALLRCAETMGSTRKDAELIGADVEFHEVLAQATGNPLFNMMILGLREPLQQSIERGLRGLRRQRQEALVPEIHAEIAGAIARGDGAGAANRMAHHFDVTVAAIVGQQTTRNETQRRADAASTEGRERLQ